MYVQAIVNELEALFADDATRCREITASEWEKRGMGERLIESIGRLMAPML